MTIREKKDIETLKDYYTIKGDGIASLKINCLIEDSDFQETLTRLAAFKLKKEHNSDTNSP